MELGINSLSYVCLTRRGHRLAKRRVTAAEFASAEHRVVISATGCAG